MKKNFYKVAILLLFVILLPCLTFSGCQTSDDDSGQKGTLSLKQSFKTTYFSSENVDLSGGLIEYTKGDDKKTIAVESYMISGFQTRYVGNYVMVIAYQDAELEVNYTVTANFVSYIELYSTSFPNVFSLNETLNLTNAQIKVTYANGSISYVPIYRNMVTGFDTSSKSTQRTMTITYGGKTLTRTYAVSPIKYGQIYIYPESANGDYVAIKPNANGTITLYSAQNLAELLESFENSQVGNSDNINFTINSQKTVLTSTNSNNDTLTFTFSYQNDDVIYGNSNAIILPSGQATMIEYLSTPIKFNQIYVVEQTPAGNYMAFLITSGNVYFADTMDYSLFLNAIQSNFKTSSITTVRNCVINDSFDVVTISSDLHARDIVLTFNHDVCDGICSDSVVTSLFELYDVEP